MKESVKRIFNRRVAQYLIDNGAKLVGTREGEVKERLDRITYLFIKNERLFAALDEYKVNGARK
ncbi:hypothetical protein [Bacillus wiedmannii]|uniref:hypothetical protein n=1 Tax=Bacillus wiedmannii TaxID=1890302 RepID=UPI000BF619BB|nr:hypothetical protein [Bacillus wiedmannii]PFZ64879.1 hypothetical protein COL76_13080 [Bacillus wiedmannii]